MHASHIRCSGGPAVDDRILQDLITTAMLLRAAERSGLQAPPEGRLLWHAALNLLDGDIELLRASARSQGSVLRATAAHHHRAA